VPDGLRFYSLSIVAGSLACNARCPFCVASMTPLSGIAIRPSDPDFDEIGRVAAFARACGATQAMITSKGEPTLWPDHVTGYLEAIRPHGFEVVDLQTNGVAIADGKPVTAEHLATWRTLGLDVVAISIVHWLPELNRPIYLPYRSTYIDLPKLIDTLHASGFTVRLAAVMLDGYIDGADDLAGLLAFARANGVEQVTVRPVKSTGGRSRRRGQLVHRGQPPERPAEGGPCRVPGGGPCRPDVPVGRHAVRPRRPEHLPHELADQGRPDSRGRPPADRVPGRIRVDVVGARRRAVGETRRSIGIRARMSGEVASGRPPLLAMKAVYSYLYPEVRAAVASFDEAWRPELLRNDVDRNAVVDFIDAVVSPRVASMVHEGASTSTDDLHVPVLDRVGDIHAPFVAGLDGFPWRYPTSGSSEGLFHLLVHLQRTGTTTIRVLDGEYEGYGAWAGHLGLSVESIAIDDASGLAPDNAACWFISNPSARDGCLLPGGLLEDLRARGNRLVLDLAYLGATDPAHASFDVGDPSVEAVVLSLSKPYGLFRWRIGYLWSRTEIPTLYANKWFKDIGRHLLGLKVLEEVGPAALWPRHVDRQREIIEALRRDYDAPVRASDALILAYMPTADLDALPVEVQSLLAPYRRGPNARLCLTPYFETADPIGETWT
jgi:pyruvate-formate lyase-activating enzyme